MQQSPWKANSRSASQEIHRLSYSLPCLQEPATGP